MEGRVFKIKRFSVHDGPGIRTSIFLLGCPLNCVWCHSPEGINSSISIWYDNKACIACGECVRACKKDALKLVIDIDSHIVIDYAQCNVNGDCVKICPTGAISFTGSQMNTDEVMNEIEKDLLYYSTSGGGVTFTGGEPLFQADFLMSILRECRKKNIHTAIETSLFCETQTLEVIAGYVDLFLADLKLFSNDSHLRFTGKPNTLIKENLRFLAGLGKKIIVRIPLIEGITDTEKNKSAIIQFVNETDSRITIEFIPSNPLAANNYKKLGIPFLL
jgi:pyruvate formate lyase activating enzyme